MPGLQSDGTLGARGDAQTASVTLIGFHDERLSIAVRERLELSEESQARALIGTELRDFKDVIGADAHAIGLRFAAIAIDNRRDASRFRRTFRGHNDGFSRRRDVCLRMIVAAQVQSTDGDVEPETRDAKRATNLADRAVECAVSGHEIWVPVEVR